jgi:hypothetical protein
MTSPAPSHPLILGRHAWAGGHLSLSFWACVCAMHPLPSLFLWFSLSLGKAYHHLCALQPSSTSCSPGLSPLPPWPLPLSLSFY